MRSRRQTVRCCALSGLCRLVVFLASQGVALGSPVSAPSGRRKRATSKLLKGHYCSARDLLMGPRGVGASFASEARHSTPRRSDCEPSGSLFEAPKIEHREAWPRSGLLDLTALRLPLSSLFRIQLSPIVDVRVGLEVHEDITKVREPIEQLILDKMTDAMALIDGLISADLDVDIDEIFQA